jgi:hypothetical protein
MADEIKTQEEDLTKKRMDICIPLAQMILKKLGEIEAKMGDASKEDMMEAYKPLVADILKVYAETDLPLAWCGFVKQLTLQPFEFVFGMLDQSLTEGLRKLEVKTFGKELGDTTTKEIDGLLRAE